MGFEERVPQIRPEVFVDPNKAKNRTEAFQEIRNTVENGGEIVKIEGLPNMASIGTDLELLEKAIPRFRRAIDNLRVNTDPIKKELDKIQIITRLDEITESKLIDPYKTNTGEYKSGYDRAREQFQRLLREVETI